tara:strand:- start:1144 stop:5658 length:4515 start_codon:yes stop_codon:yes gene_type:complete
MASTSKPTQGSKVVKPRKKSRAKKASDITTDPVISDDRSELIFKNNTFPIVGLGASAGGLQAFTDFFKAMPADSGMAFVAIHHVDPDHESLMADLLAKHTSMSVVLAKDHTKVEPNHVYIIPPSYFLKIDNGVLYLTEPDARRGMRLPIDYFLTSLAEERKQNTVAVILSGTGSDGTAGVRSIKANGGMVIAQNPKEASHDGMPRSAVASGSVDHVLRVNQMPKVIMDFCNHPYISKGKAAKVLGENARGSLGDIIDVLKAYSPINFEFYKEGTLLRRIERRMVLKHMDNSVDYLAFLKDSPDEVEKLFGDFLISVTSFFRDPESFKYLEKKVLHDLEAHQRSDKPIRVWVPGCASGEEAYSLAMLLIENITANRKHIKLQIFASDVDDRALEVARAGIYPGSIEADVSPARLRRFFIKEDHTYRVSPELRDSVVFANQNVLADAPFSKLDIISRRNLLIYLNSEAQERIIRMFHFALNDGGLLFLGSSETVSSFEELFQPLSKKFKLYKRVGKAHSRPYYFPVKPRVYGDVQISSSTLPEMNRQTRLADVSQKFLVEHYAPVAVLINQKMELLFVQGPADLYLRVPAGESSQDLLAMARDGLRAKLGSTIRKSMLEGAEISSGGTVTRNGTTVPVAITVHPLDIEGNRLLLVTFVDKPLMENIPVPDEGERDNSEAYRHLEQELEATRIDLQTTVKDYERSTEELKAINEEAMSMNEEFQSTNEELETSKEELQSLNEELTTLNTQLQQKVDDERRMSDDLNNLLSSSGIATLFLDRQLSIMRFTPATRELFNVLVNDIGRPFGDITGKLDDPKLLKDAAMVLEDLTPVEVEVRSAEGRWYLRRILPYVTQAGKVDGVVLTFLDVTALKVLEQSNKAALRLTENIVDTVREPLLVLDGKFTIIKASRSFYKDFGTVQTKTVGVNLFDLQGGQWDLPALRKLLERILPDKTTIESFKVTLSFKAKGARTMLLNARQIQREGEGDELILMTIEDVTERDNAQKELQEREARLSAILNAIPEAVLTINEDGIIGSFSPAAEKIFGYAAKEVLGQSVNILMPKSDSGEGDGDLSHYMTSRDQMNNRIGQEIYAHCKDGSKVPIRLRVAEFWYDEKRHFIGVLHDLTEEKKRREELQRAQKMEAVGQLTGGIAHDFNNLLTVITGNLEMLDMQLEDETQRVLLGEAEEASALGAQLTNRLLAFSKRQTLEPKNVCLNDLITTMTPLLRRSLGEEITIVTRLADDLKPTLSDPGQIENTLLNLAINGRHAMPKGGVLTIETQNVYLDEDYAATQVDVEPGPYIALSVSDTGTGMSEDIRERAFEPFFSTKTPGNGFGLGLSMIYGFAKQSGGHVAIYSEEGVGTTINLYLPPAISMDVQDEKAESLPGDISKNVVVLVVEDDERVRRLTVHRLEKLGYQVIATNNGREAVKTLKENDHIDLVLSDVIMPGGMTGFEVADEALKINPKLKILLASGYVDAKQAESNPHRFLRKPYSIKDLSNALADLLTE